MSIIEWFTSRMIDIVVDRRPDFVIGENYLRRWWLIPRNPIFNVYLHQYTGSDDDRALHDHPWPSASLMLVGALVEYDQHGKKLITRGQWRFRSARYAHRLELGSMTSMTLFITGPKYRNWGFLCPQGWRPWQEFCAPNDRSKIGRGCD